MKEVILARYNAAGVEALNRQFADLGISFQVDGGVAAVLIDDEKFHRAKTRLAGRKLKPVKSGGYIVNVTVMEIEERMKSETANEIAASLGISRATLFRRLKFAREFGIDEI